MGEWATTSAATGKGNRLEIYQEIHFPHSLGLLYSAFTYYTGFKVNSGEYKLMGLAPYGTPRFAQKIYDDFERLAPHRAFALAADGKGYLWTGANGADPGAAVTSVLKTCEERSKSKCTLYAVNNVVLNGRDWKTAAPQPCCRRSAGCGPSPTGRTRARRPPPG